jgi:hypothetical protein
MSQCLQTVVSSTLVRCSRLQLREVIWREQSKRCAVREVLEKRRTPRTWFITRKSYAHYERRSYVRVI